MSKPKFKLPRLLWSRKPQTQIIINKKAKNNKRKCRDKK